MKTLLICHEGAEINQMAVARWLASFSDLVGVIVLRETKQRVWRRLRREIKRVGIIRFLDVIAFRGYYKLFLSHHDDVWQKGKIKELCVKYPKISVKTAFLYTHNPNTPEAKAFIERLAPDLMLARCKTLLKENVFSIPGNGTFVMHSGICPEYRNAHGCFWALANDDFGKVGMTLLQIDKGVDTGPIYGYYTYDYDAVAESHIVIQNRSLLENLDSLRDKLIEIYKGVADPLDTFGRQSATFGQPWLTKYIKWKYSARRRKNAVTVSSS